MTRIAVVTHKEYEMPESPLYIPVMAGAASHTRITEAYMRDDKGDNISDRNSTFSELTALYWLWKHHDEEYPDAEYLGLCHYRRLFAANKGRRLHLLSEAEADSLMDKGSIVLPKKRDYLIETNYSHYVNAHHAADLDLTRDIIAERHREYLDSYDKYMGMTGGHRFNMFIMPRQTMDEYCGWLFDILFELEQRLDISDYKCRDRRVFGLVAERLMDVWIDANKRTYMEIPYIMTEKESMLLKGAMLLSRKIRGMVNDRKGKG